MTDPFVPSAPEERRPIEAHPEPVGSHRDTPLDDRIQAFARSFPAKFPRPDGASATESGS
jgi:hypothetical protein